MQFLARLSQIEIYNREGGRLTADEIVDHGKSWSIYFKDPYGHLLEVTTYDYNHVAERSAIARRSCPSTSAPYNNEADYADMRRLLIDALGRAGPPVYATVGDIDWWRVSDDDPNSVNTIQLWFDDERLGCVRLAGR